MNLAGKNLWAAALLSPLIFVSACSTQSAMNDGLEPQTSFAAVGPKSDPLPGNNDATPVALAEPAQPASAEVRLQQEASAEAPDVSAVPAGFAGSEPSSPVARQKAVQLASLDTGEDATLAQTDVSYEAPASVVRRARPMRASSRDQECLARAMYFESNRSSREGMVAVGSVIMNRLDSGKWGNSVCGVVGAPRQFAPGVMTRSMTVGSDLAFASAASVLKGERHPRIYKDVMFFHTAGYKFPYDNMHYVAVAGGNSFYEKRRRMRGRPNTPQHIVMRQSRGAPEDQVVAAALVETPKRERPFEKAAKAKRPRRPVDTVEPLATGTVQAKPAALPAVVDLPKEAELVNVPATKGGRVRRAAAY